MRVDEKLSFNDYWNAAEFQRKKPARNGSHTVLVGDNIYHRDGSVWVQEDSHHSNQDGSINLINLRNDTGTDAVLASRHFYYFGSNAVEIPKAILDNLGYRNGRNHRVFENSQAADLLAWLKQFPLNLLSGEPNDFQQARARYSGVGSRIENA